MFQANVHGISMQLFELYIALPCKLSKICAALFELIPVLPPFLTMGTALDMQCRLSNLLSFILGFPLCIQNRSLLHPEASFLFCLPLSFHWSCEGKLPCFCSFSLASFPVSYKWFDIFTKDLNEGLEEIMTHMLITQK